MNSSDESAFITPTTPSPGPAWNAKTITTPITFTISISSGKIGYRGWPRIFQRRAAWEVRQVCLGGRLASDRGGANLRRD